VSDDAGSRYTGTHVAVINRIYVCLPVYNLVLNIISQLQLSIVLTTLCLEN
jgi:hypothetical protein